MISAKTSEAAVADDVPVEHTLGALDGRRVLVRCEAAGVHVGVLGSRQGREVQLAGARRLWRWHTGGTGVSLSEVSLHGIDQERSKICEAVPSILLLDAIEVIPMSDDAWRSVVTAEVFKP